MSRLSAEFSFEIASPCLAAWPEGESPEFAIELRGFHVNVKFLFVEYWRSKGKDDAYWTTGVSALEVEVSRDEATDPPPPIETPDGKTDLIAQGKYLRERLTEYQTTALEIANRVLRFFQYSLQTPLVQPIPLWAMALHNPTWSDSDGQVLRGGTHTVVAAPVPGLHGELGAGKLDPAELLKLQAFVNAPSEPTLADTLLSDAQTAWFQGNLRRSVLELAICAEIMVKRRFFAKASPAGAAFDYLEDKAKISVRVLDLLDAVADEAFGRSYKKEEAADYQRIDYLFRCRNKIAHRGELTFRDDSGRTINVDRSLVEGWWHAVAHLRTWLAAV